MTTHTAAPTNNMPPLRLDPHGQRVTKERAEELLHGKLLPAWQRDAGNVIQAIEERAGLMQDRIAKSSAMKWALGDAKPNTTPKLNIHVGDATLGVHNNAMQQAAALADIPAAYVTTLQQQDPELLVANLNKRFDRRGNSRQLIRSVGTEARAVLSDKYRRLDSRPIIESLTTAAQKLGLVPMGGTATDLRFRLRMALPKVHEVIPGEFVMFGLDWGNSDFGRGAHDLSAFFLRVICNNGLVMESAMRQVHLGRRLEGDGVLSDRTLSLDTQTAASAVADVIHAYLEPAKVEERLLAVRNAATSEVSATQVDAFLKKHLSKEAVQKAREAYLSADVEMIPPGQTVWRLSNALSWLANTTTDKEEAIDMQELAGRVFEMSPRAAAAA